MELVTIQEASRRLHLATSEIRQCIHNGELKAYRNPDPNERGWVVEMPEVGWVSAAMAAELNRTFIPWWWANAGTDRQRPLRGSPVRVVIRGNDPPIPVRIRERKHLDGHQPVPGNSLSRLCCRGGGAGHRDNRLVRPRPLCPDPAPSIRSIHDPAQERKGVAAGNFLDGLIGVTAADEPADDVLSVLG